MINFNIDERSIINMYKGMTANRTSTINRILSNIDYVEEKELKDLMNITATKLKKITDEEFSVLDLEDTLIETPVDENNWTSSITKGIYHLQVEKLKEIKQDMELKRSELNNLIVSEATKDQFLSISIELDSLINDFLSLKNNKYHS